LRKGAGIDEQLNDEEEYEPLPDRCLNANNGVVETRPDENTSDDLVRDLDNDVGDDECFPRVRLAWSFSDLIECPLGQE
jgi:hypothetical protein